MSLRELPFFDLFVTPDPADAWYKETPGSFDRKPVPAADRGEIEKLYTFLKAQATGEFKVDWKEVRYRVERRNIVSNYAAGEVIFVCRRFLIRPDGLITLGVPSALVNKLLDPTVRDGLIVVFGGVGTGKSTVAGTLVKERITLHGGVAWTIENPVEADLSVNDGRGIIYQTEVGNEDEVGGEIVKTLRSSPNLIYIGEIRKNSAALEAVHAATSGHLIVTTHHGNNVSTGLARLAEKSGSASFLADALHAAIHLDLKPSAFDSKKLRLTVEPLWVTGADNEEGIRTTLRKGDFHLLKNDIERQRRLFQEGKL